MKPQVLQTMTALLAAFLATVLFARLLSDSDSLGALLLAAYIAVVVASAAIAANRLRDRIGVLGEELSKADEMSRAKSEFLATLSLKMRTPLSVILGFARIQRNRETTQRAGDQLNSEETLSAAQQLINLIQDVLDLSRIEQGELHVKNESCKLGEVMSHASSLVREDSNMHSVRLLVEDSPLVVSADYTRLKQVFVKLFGNAIRYNRPGGEVRVVARQGEPGWVECSISDTGIGISERDREKVFQPFVRFENDRHGGAPGTGIGLALVRFLVDSMGGEIDIVSSSEAGTEFLLKLRQGELSAEAGAPSLTEDLPPANDSSKQLLVIYVEDDTPSQELVKAILDPVTHVTVLTANDAEAGIELARKNHPDLMLLDINLSGHGMSGIEAAQAIRSSAQLRDVPLVAISAEVVDSVVQSAMDAGFSRYLTKPLNIEELLEVIQLVGSGELASET